MHKRIPLILMVTLLFAALSSLVSCTLMKPIYKDALATSKALIMGVVMNNY